MSKALDNKIKLNTDFDKLGVYVTDYGAVPDGITTSTQAFTDALTAAALLGVPVLVPAGNYYIDGSGSQLLNPPTNTRIIGAGKRTTKIIFDGSAVYFEGIRTNGDGLTIEDLTIEVRPVSGQEAVAIRVLHSDIELNRVEFDGTMVYSGSFNHNAYGISLGTSGAQNNLRFYECGFTRFAFPLLKTNIATSTQDEIKYDRCRFYGNFREDISFNGPNGAITDVKVTNCHFENHGGLAAGLDAIYVALASVRGFIVSGNSFRGAVREVIHMEEACQNGVISNNDILVDIDTNGAGIAFLENDVAGLFTLPKNIIVEGNTIIKDGTLKETNTFGIWLINNGSSTFAAEQIIVRSNLIDGFGVGISGLVANDAVVEVVGNLAISCATGFLSQSTTSSWRGNTSKLCDIGIASVNGGSFEQHRFIECTTNADAQTAFPLILIDPTFIFGADSFTASETKQYILFPLSSNSRMYGIASTNVNSDTSPRYSSISNEVIYDGTSLTNTNKVTIQPSSISGSFNLTSGNFRIALFSTIILSGVRLSATIRGQVVIEI